jgi:IclR family acetate operon transcriptional repressor
VVAAARPVLEDAAARLGETLFLAGARGKRLVVLDKQEGAGFLRASPRVGEEIPAHATAIGKLYLAFAPESLDATTASLEAFTAQTRTATGALERELEEVRRARVAHNDQEWIPGLAGVAAPIFCRGRLIAAVAVSGSSARFARGEFTPAVVAAGTRIGRLLEGADLGRSSS